MADALKIGTAALGGYVLGRTKKAKAAISLALWLSGRGRPRDIARDQAVRLLRTDRAQDLLGQVRGPILSAGRSAALALFEAQAGRLSDNLQKRTDQLGESVDGAGRSAKGAVGGASATASRLADRRRRALRAADEPDEGELDEAEEDEYVDEEDDLAPSDEVEDEDEYADEYDEAEPAEETEDDEEIDDDYVDETDELDEPEEPEDEEEPEEEPAPRRRSRASASSGRATRGGSGRSSRSRSRRSVPA